MSVRFIDSFDHYENGDSLKKWTGDYLNQGGIDIITGGGRCSSNAASMGSVGFVTKGITLHASATASKGIVGFAWYNFNGTQEFFQLYSGNTKIFTVWWLLDGSLAFYTGNTDTLIATSAPDVVRDTTWYFLEFKWTLHASAGDIIIRVNEVEVINETGVATTSGPTTWSAIAFSSTANASCKFDDLYVCDDYDDGLTPATNDFLGDVRVEYLRPTATGNYTDWDVSSGTQWEAVDKDDVSTDTDPSVSTLTTNEILTNIYANPSIQTGTVYAVQTNIQAKKDVAAATTIAAVVRSGGSDALGADHSPSETSYSYHIDCFDRNPVSAAAWSINDVNNAEFGVKKTS